METIAVVAIMAVIFTMVYSITSNSNRIFKEGMAESDVQEAARSALSQVSESIKGAVKVIAADNLGIFKDINIDYTGMGGLQNKLLIIPLSGEPYIYALKNMSDNSKELCKIFLTANTNIVHKDYLISGDITEAKFWKDFMQQLQDLWSDLVTHEDKYKYISVPYAYENVDGTSVPYINIDGKKYYVSLDPNYKLDQVNRKALYQWEGSWFSGSYEFVQWEDDYTAKAEKDNIEYNINLADKPDEYIYDSYKIKDAASSIKSVITNLKSVTVEMENENLFKIRVDIKEGNRNRTYYTAASTRNYGGD